MHQSPIYYSDFSELNKFIEENNSQKFFFLVDENTHTYCLPLLLAEIVAIDDIEIIEIPIGEEAKEIEVAIQVWKSLLELEADRNSIIINCGGGVVTDFGGFIASTFKRGIKFINIPTSLLAMVDASVGGKTGVNLSHSKNQIGTFAQPEMVIIHSEFLETLPQREILSGYGEMLKHGLIQSKDHWKQLTSIKELKAEHLHPFIKDSVDIKKDVVEKDPLEKGLRRILNAGHTLGHALESWYLDNNISISHGEAVVIGLILESYISNAKGILSSEDFVEIINSILPHFKPYDLPNMEQILKYLNQDKKNSGGKVQFILIEEIGKCLPNTHQVEKALIHSALSYYKNNYK